MEYFSLILTVSIIHLLAVISPGPDFLMITRNSLVYSRKTGIYSSIGLGIGILLHVTYSLVGIGFIIAQSIVLFNVIKYLGAAYLIYIGIKSLTSKTSHITKAEENEALPDISKWKAIKIGFLTNALNPKVTLFFLSVFTLVISPTTPLVIKLFMGAEMALVTSLWFSFVALIFSLNIIKDRISRVQNYAVKFIGVVLILLGVKVALSSAK